MKDDEEELFTCRQELQAMLSKMEEDTKSLSDSKAQLSTKKKELDTVEEEIARVYWINTQVIKV